MITDLEQFFAIDFRLSVLCYVDDIMILSYNEETLQLMLNHVAEWCSKWCLKVNTNTSKVIHVRPKRLVHTLYREIKCWIISILCFILMNLWIQTKV